MKGSGDRNAAASGGRGTGLKGRGAELWEPEAGEMWC